MLGDSLTAGGEWQEFFPDSKIVNRGIGRDTAQGVLNRVEAYLVQKPEKVFLLIGINDLLDGVDITEVSDKVAAITRLITSKSPSTKIFIQSVLPCRKDLVPKEKILQLNERLKTAINSSNISFIDVYSRFIDKNYEQIPLLFLVDGVHLSTSGYKEWVEVLKPFVL